jgi:hypothetical protein
MQTRNPSARFNIAYYLVMNPEAASSCINPLYHYILYGKDEGRAITYVISKD